MNREKVVKGIKLGLNIIAGLGIELLCSALAGNLAGTSKSGGIKKTCMAIGGMVIGGMVSAQAEKYIDTEVDNLVAKFDEIKTFVDDASAEKKEETT